MKVCSIRQSAFTGLPICLSIPGGDIGTGEGLHEVCFAGTVYNRHYEKVDSEIKDITDDLPFEIPDNWAWTRFSQIVSFDLGKTPDRYNKRYWNNGKYPWFTIADLQEMGAVSSSKEKISEIALNEKFAGKLIPRGTLLMSFKLTVGKTSILDVDAVHNEAIISIFPIISEHEITRDFLLNALPVLVLCVKKRDAVKGATLNSSKLATMFVPLPPLSEQQRIVSRIEKLFDQITAIEQNQADIDTLYEEFRKRTLTLAIQGKLVPQDPNDEPASELLERIRAEKKAKLGKKYVDSYIYKGDDNCYYEKVGETVTNINDEIPFDLPENWAWCRLQTICSYIHRGKSPTYGTEKILPIIAQKCNQWAGIQTQKCLFADRASIKKYTEEQYLCIGDIIINSTGTGTVGRTGYVDDTLFKEYPKFVADSHVTVVRPLEYIDSKYIYLFLKSPVIQTDIEAKCSGSTNQIELATKTIQSYLIPLPPTTEQYRITSCFFALEAKLKDKD